MRMEAIAISVLLLMALVPSMLRTWRSALMAAAGFYGLLAIGFLLVLRSFELTSEEGPAFVGLILLYGLVTLVLGSAFITRITISFVLSNLTQPNARRLRCFLIVSGLTLGVLAAFAVHGFYIGRGFAIMIGAASAWLVVVTWLMPNNSFKPRPLRGSA